MSAEEMFQEISSHDGTMYYIAATNGPSDFAVVQSLMFGLEDNSKLTVRFTADTDVNLVYPSSDCCMSCEDGDKSYEGVTFDAIITRVHKLPGWKQFEIVFSITELPTQGEFIGVYDAHERNGKFSPFREEN